MSSAKYSVFSYITDVDHQTSVPVGIAIWSSEKEFADIRIRTRDERIAGLKKPANTLIELVDTKVRKWLEAREVPRADARFDPWDDRWWMAARSRLFHRVRLSEPRAIDCAEPAQEVERLYESIVGAHRQAEPKHRVDGEISRCLGPDLADRFATRAPVRGYGGRDVVVLKCYAGKVGWAIVEGIDLTRKPDEASDTVLGRLTRVKRGGLLADMVVGYLPSPHGLNGETPLVRIIQDETGAKTFDLVRERDQLRDAVTDAVARADGQESLD